MLARTWFVLSLSICLCEFPCGAQRSNPFVSHGSFGRGPAMPRMNGGGQFRPGRGYGPFVRPPSPYGPRVLPPMRSMRNFREWPDFSSRAQKAIPRSSFSNRDPDRLSGPDVTRPLGPGSESPGAFPREGTMGSSPPRAPLRIQPPTQRTNLSVPRPPSGVPRSASAVPRPPFRFQGVSPFLPRPPLRSAAIDGNSHFAGIPRLARSRVLLSSRSFSPFLSNPFFSRHPFLFSPFFSNTFFFPRPLFFSPFFSNPFLFQQPFFFSPFFSNEVFFSLSFSNAFFFPRPLLFSPFFSNPFFFQQPFFFSPFFSNGFFFQRSFHFRI